MHEIFSKLEPVLNTTPLNVSPIVIDHLSVLKKVVALKHVQMYT